MKVCSQCNTSKPLSEYYSAGIIDGKEYTRANCKTCHKSAANARQDRLREEYMNWKKTLSCNRCGYDDYRAIQFHHHGDKEHNIADMLTKGFTLAKIQAEADKCEILCANCHQIEHHKPE